MAQLGGVAVFGSEVLEVGIGLALMFLIISLICTAVRELIEAVLRQRSSDLERGIRELLAEGHDREIVAAQAAAAHAGANALQQARLSVPFTRALYAHGQIQSLFAGSYPNGNWRQRFGKRGHLPSYIPSEQFAVALMDVVKAAGGASASTQLTVAQLRSSLNALPDGPVKQAIGSAIDNANGDLAVVRANLASWFDGSMDRVSGWYKRKTQAILFGLGLAIAIALNIDALTVARRLAEDDALRAAFLARAEHADEFYVAGASTPAADTERDEAPVTAPRQGATAQTPAIAQADGRGANTGSTTADDPGSDNTAEAAKPAVSTATSGETTAPAATVSIDRYRDELAKIGAPVGWVTYPVVTASRDDESKPGVEERSFAVEHRRYPGPQTRCLSRRSDGSCASFRPPKYYDWAGIVMGWLATAAAVTLGAPFWFDALNKMMVIRSTVKPAEKSPPEGSEDRKSGTRPPRRR